MKLADSANHRRTSASQNSEDLQARREAISARQIKSRESQTSEKLQAMGEPDSLDPPEISFQKLILKKGVLIWLLRNIDP